ncbi:hypothetical protein HY214_04810 [Candidatus Roizmanbacteria bacterium]|nr:hypothetical protein [Candidatus Roizmanbacteria bacterium]
MGKGKISQGGGSLTEADFEEMGKKWGMTKEESKQNTLELLKRELEVKK